MENEINEEKKKLTGIVEESGGGSVGETEAIAWERSKTVRQIDEK